MKQTLSASSERGHRRSSVLERRGFVYIIVFVASLLLLRVGWILKGGTDVAIRSDSDEFIQAGYAILNWITAEDVNVDSLTSHAVFPRYLVPSLVFGIIFTYCDNPILKVVALNCVLFSLVVVLVYQFWVTLQGKWRCWAGEKGIVVAGIGVLYITFGLPDAFLWSYTVLTDIVFLFWVSVFVVSAARGILGGGWVFWILALLTAVLAPFIRPTGILLPLLFVYALIIWSLLKYQISTRVVTVVSIGLSLVMAFLTVPWLVSAEINDSAWIEYVIPDTLKPDFNQAVYYFKSGVVVSGRLETYTDTPTTGWDTLKIILHRLAYYWVPLRLGEPPYSPGHNIINAIYVMVAWPLMLVGIKQLGSSGRPYRMLALFLVMVALSFGLLHSVTLLSFDWRYQLPAMVPLWILAGVGLFAVLGYSRS